MYHQNLKDMKKLLFLLAIMVLPVCSRAQKTYVNIVATDVNKKYHTMYLSGDIPSGVKSFYDAFYDELPLGDVINQLASYGFVVEQMSCSQNESTIREIVLLSKNASPSPTKAQEVIGQEKDGDAVEVARYNLQGMPVSTHEKGVQIVVYSNYTTRTVIVE